MADDQAKANLSAKRSPNGRFLPGHGAPGPGRPPGLKERIARAVDPSRLFEWMAEVAEGRPVVPTLPDGRQGPPVTFSGADILAARRYLCDAYNGKPVPQTEVVAAELASQDLIQLQAMSDDQVRELAAKFLERQPALPPVQGAVPGTVAEDE